MFNLFRVHVEMFASKNSGKTGVPIGSVIWRFNVARLLRFANSRCSCSPILIIL